MAAPAPHIRRLDYQGRALGQIPPEPNKAFYELDPNVRLLWTISRIFSWLTTFVGLATGYFLLRVSAPQYEPLAFFALSAMLLPASISVFSPWFTYRSWGLYVRESDLVVRWGLIWQRVLCIPFARIQHVESHAGPLERSFGMANLTVFTAGNQVGAVTIPGLPGDLAVSLRDFLSQVGHQHANL